MLLLSLRGSVAAAGTIVQPGTYEAVVAGFEPAVYLKFAETSGTSFADSSGNGRVGTLQGMGALCGVSSLAPNVGSTNRALDLGSTAWLEIAHAAADTALIFPSSQPWLGGRKIADCTVSLYFKPNSLPSGANKAVIVAKSSAQTPGAAASYDGSWEAYIDNDGAVHVECRSFRGRPCRIRTPNGAVAAGATCHLVVQLAYDGLAAWLDGAKFEDGYANLLHVYGLAADIRGTVHQNNFAWTIGKAAWGGQADLVVDEFAIYLSTLTTAQAQSIAQSGSVGPLAHPIWGQAAQNASGSVVNIQSAIDSLNSAGGGTVLIAPGTYSGNITLKSNVRIKTAGGTVQINGALRCASVSTASLGAGTGDIAVGDRTLNVSNSRSVGDLVTIEGGANLRHDRRWNTLAESNDPTVNDVQTFEIESRNASSMTFVGSGSIFEFTAGNRAEVLAWTPTSWIAAEGDIRFSAPNAILLARCRHARLVGIRGTNTDVDSEQGITVQTSAYVQGRDLTNVQAIWNGVSQSENDGIQAAFACSDVVFKECDVFDGRHAADVGGNAAQGGVTRIEFHNITWDNTNSRLAPGSRSAFGIHGVSTDCIYWNCTSNWAGPSATGWRHDSRWMVCGDPNAAGSGEIIINDGAGDCWYRDFHIIRPGNWFRATGGAVGVKRNRFENITHSQPPTGVTHSGLNYGTGEESNTFINVDTPPP
jgi:hypothetical protein